MTPHPALGTAGFGIRTIRSAALELEVGLQTEGAEGVLARGEGYGYGEGGDVAYGAGEGRVEGGQVG